MARSDVEWWDGALRGAIGGVAGLVAMELYFRTSRALTGGSGEEAEADDAGDEDEGLIQGSHALGDISLVGDTSRDDESSTEAVGRIVHEAVSGLEPSDERKKLLGQLVHWGYGILLGSLYGAFRSETDGADFLGGLGFGAAAWAWGDELMVPLLGLSEGPTAHVLSEHASALAAHLAYGAATSVTTQALRRVL